MNVWIRETTDACHSTVVMIEGSILLHEKNYMFDIFERSSGDRSGQRYQSRQASRNHLDNFDLTYVCREDISRCCPDEDANWEDERQVISGGP